MKDSGIGINKQNQKKVFDRFYREVDHEENTYPGLGMGLYIASEIVKQHKGSMGVASRKGEGSTFSFTIPSK